MFKRLRKEPIAALLVTLLLVAGILGATTWSTVWSRFDRLWVGDTDDTAGATLGDDDAFIAGDLDVGGTIYPSISGNISFPLVGQLIAFTAATGTSSIATVTEYTAPGLELDDAILKLVWTDGQQTKRQATFHVPDDYLSGGVFELFATRSAGGGSGGAPSVQFEQYVLAAGETMATPDIETAVELSDTAGSTPQQVTLTPNGQTYAAGDRVTVNYWRDDIDTSTDDLEVINAIWTYTRKL